MRFYKDPKKIYLDSAKAGPMYYELLDWRTKFERKSLVEKSQIRNNHENLVKDVEKKISKFFNVKDGSIFFTKSFSLGFHSLLNEIKRKPSFLVLEDDYPSISEAIINKGFKIIYVKNDALVEKNIENAIKKYEPNFIAISIIQWIDGLQIDIDFLKYLKVESTILIGNSMGGMLAQILAFKLEDKCKGLFLSCTYKGKASHKAEPLAKNYEQRIGERNRLNDRDFGELRVDSMLAGPLEDNVREFLISIAGEIRLEGIEWGARAIQYLDTSPFLKKLNTPVLILSGTNDIVVKPDALEALVASLPTAHHKKMSNVGHAPYCENSSEFNQILDRFIITCSNR